MVRGSFDTLRLADTPHHHPAHLRFASACRPLPARGERGQKHFLTAPPRPRKATAMGLARTIANTAGTAQQPAPDTLSALFKLGRPLVMGILNVTPDSFSDGGQF